METKITFSNNSGKEVFEILSEILKKEIVELIKAPCSKTSNKTSTNQEKEERDKRFEERKELLVFLMKAKDAGELNDLHEKFVSFEFISLKI